MTDEEINKYVDMGDIEKDEEVTTERAMAEVYRWIRVVEHESYEYENLTPKVLNMAIKALQEKDNAEVRPMQVELEADGYADGELVYDFGKCPNCGWEFEEGDKDWEEPYCCHCGQKLKWFETEEEE